MGQSATYRNVVAQVKDMEERTNVKLAPWASGLKEDYSPTKDIRTLP